MLNVCGFTVKTNNKIVYHNLESASRSVPHNDDDLPVPVPAENGFPMSDEEVLCEETTKVDAVFVLEKEDELAKFSQVELNDLDISELLATRLKEKSLLKDVVCFTHFRKRRI